jgi:tetratricopeptide (TPR) repeat protein
VLLKFPGNESLAGTYIDKSVSLDTTEADKVADLKSIATVYESRKQYKDAADWYKKVVDVRAMPTRVDLFNAGYNYYRSADPQTCITMFSIYTQKYPDDILGYYWVGKASWVIDSTMTLGLANPSFGKVIQLGEPMPDKSKIKVQLMTAYRFMVVYYANIRKDRDSALYYCDRALAVDPTDQETITNRDVISKSPVKPAPKAGVTTVNAKGEKVTIGADGSVTTIAKDGSSTVVTKDGKVTTVKNGVTTILENGKITTIDKDGKTTTVPAPPKQNTPAPGTPKKK